MLVYAGIAVAAFWLGPSFAGHDLDYHDETGIYVYGTCEIPPDQDEGGCSPPLQLQNRSTCQRNVVALDVLPRRIYRLRGGAIAAAYDSGHIDVGTGHTTTTVYAIRDRFARRATRAMRKRGQRRPHALSAPEYPPAVLKELKRAVIGGRHVRGLKPGVVRARARLAHLLPAGTLRDVSVPKRSWAQVQHDRQISFAAQVHQAQQLFHVSRKQVLGAVRRVRGLTGSC